MNSIFLSYRRNDYDTSVKNVESLLVSEFGADSVTLDKNSFVGGMEWAQQIRSNIIQADIIVCVIGESWLIKQQKETDYVCEELNLARSLGKPVIPAVIDLVDINSVAQSLPQSIKWLMELQVIHVNPTINQSIVSFCNTIRDLTGEANVRSEKNSLQLPFFIALQKTIKSIFYPLSVAGTSFRPDSKTLKNSIIGLLISIVLLIASFIQFSPYQLELHNLTNLIFLPLKFTLELVLIIFLASFLNGKKISAISIISFSIQLSATVFICATCYISIFYLVLNSTEIFSSQHFFESENVYKAMEYLTFDVLPKLGFTSKVILSIINLGFGCHSMYVLWGFLRALGSMYSTGLKLPIKLFTCILIFLGFINFAVEFIGQGAAQDVSTLSQKLPREFIFKNVVDSQVNGIVVLSPIKITAIGNVNKEGDFIKVHVKELKIENRTKSLIRPVIYSLLYKFTNGETVTPDPIPASNTIAIGNIEANKVKIIKNITMIIKLSPNFISGETTLNTNVMDEATNTPQAIYDLDNGPTILRW